MSRPHESTPSPSGPAQADVDAAVERALIAIREAHATYAPHAHEVDVPALALLRGLTALHPDTSVEQVIDALLVRSFLLPHALKESPRG